MSPIKGHDSNDEEVVGIMKNMLFNIIHGVPVNFHDFFMRTLANIAMSPFELKPYAPWIMRFIRARSSLNYKADTLNHGSYLPPIEVLKRTVSSADDKGKAAAVIDEGIRPLDGQFHKLHLTLPMTILPHMTLPQIPQPSKILKPQLPG